MQELMHTLTNQIQTAGHALTWNGSDYEWADPGGGSMSNVVEDTTPELGGDLITGQNRIAFADTGTVSFLDFTVNQFSETNHTVLSSVKSINFI